MYREDKPDPMMGFEIWKPECFYRSPPRPPPLPPKYKQIKVNDLKWIRYLIILSS